MSGSQVFKVALLGDGGVGKTSLVRRFVHDKFDDKYLRTLGTNIYKKDLRLKRDGGEQRIILQIWDVLGQDVYTQVINSALRKVKGVIFVTDLSDRQTLVDLRKWIDRVYRNVGSASFLFIANKADLQVKMFGLSELEVHAKAFNGSCLMTSARSGENVEACFETLATSILDKKIAPPRDQVHLPRFTNKIDPKVQAADALIDQFCRELGGYERAMPVTRTVFKNLIPDFEEITDADLMRILDSFTDIIMDEKGGTTATEFRERMKAFLESHSCEGVQAE